MCLRTNRLIEDASVSNLCNIRLNQMHGNVDGQYCGFKCATQGYWRWNNDIIDATC